MSATTDITVGLLRVFAKRKVMILIKSNIYIVLKIETSKQEILRVLQNTL